MDALPKTNPTLTAGPAAGAETPAKARGSADAADGGKSDAATEGQGADAFMAALLAQGSLAVLAPAESTAPAVQPAAGTEAVTSPILPLSRPVLAALLPAALRPGPTAATTGSGDAATADPDAPAAVANAALGAVAGDAAGTVRAIPEITAARGETLNAGAGAQNALDFVRESTGAFELAVSGSPATSADPAATQGTTRAAPVVTDNPAYASRHAPLPVAQGDLFAERLNQQIAVMLNQHTQQARIACAPAELGPVDVRITIVGDEASVQLAAPHAATREALEDALPRLRAALADSGLALGQAGVFADMPQRQHQAAILAPDERPVFAIDAEAESVAPPVRMTRLGLVDAFV